MYIKDPHTSELIPFKYSKDKVIHEILKIPSLLTLCVCACSAPLLYSADWWLNGFIMNEWSVRESIEEP